MGFISKLVQLCSLALLTVMSLAGPSITALCATLSVPANSDYSAGGQHPSITVSRGNRVSISGEPLTITGPGGTAGMFNPRNGAITVNGTTLQLGAGSGAGGTFAASVNLAGNGHLAILGAGWGTSYSLGSNAITTAYGNTGTLTLNGSGALVNVSEVGAQNAMLARIAMDGDMRLAVRNGVWARQTGLENGAQITLQQGSLDLPADSSIDLTNGSRIWVQNGVARVGNLRLGADIDAPIEWLTKNNVLESRGDVIIDGRLLVDRGVASIISHTGNITIANPAGEIETNGGELHLEAQNGKIQASDGNLPLSGNITALEVEAAVVNCKNLIGMNVIAQTLTTTENASVSAFGIDIADTASIGGDLVLENLSTASRLGEMTVGSRVNMSNVGNLALTSLAAGSDVAISGGAITGTLMSGKNFALGLEESSTNIALNGLGFDNSLETGANAILRVGDLASGANPQTDVALPASSDKSGIFASTVSLRDAAVRSYGQEISLGGGSAAFTSITNPDGDLSIAGVAFSDSLAAAGRDVTISDNATFGGSGNYVAAGHNLTALMPLSGLNLLLYAGNALTAPEISASRVAALSMQVTGDARITDWITVREAEIGGNLSLDGEPYAYGAFNDFRVVGDITLRNAVLASGNAAAANITLSGSYPTEFNVIRLADGANLTIGENGYASLGQIEDDWLRANAPASATHGALGIYSPVKLGALQVSAASARSGEINFGPQSFLLVNGPSALETANPAGAISASAPVDANIADDARIAFSGDVRANNVYVVLGNNITTHYTSEQAWDDNNLDSGNQLIALKKIAERPGSFMAGALPSSEVYPDLDGSLGGVVDDAINRPGNGGSTTPAPDTPTTPTQPTPDTPTTPAQPTPDTPTTPTQPTPDTPTTPTQPAPDTPTTPTQPTPDTPTTPTQPTPDTPTTPTQPTPDTPTTPTHPAPDKPTTPTQPTPDTPTTPDLPALPHPTPGAPALPPPVATLPEMPPVPAVPDPPVESIPAGPQETPRPTPGVENPSPAPAPSVPSTPEDAPADGSIGSGPGHLNSSLGGTRFLSRVTSTLYMDHDYRGAVKTLESSARMAILGAVPQMARAANNSAVSGARQRAAFAAGGGMADVNVEDVAGHAFALWIMPLFKSAHGFDLHANNFGYDFNGNLGGVVAGADWTFGNTLRAGFDVSMGGGYSQSGGELAKTTNRMGFFGAGLYGGLQIDQLGLVLDAHYTGSWNDLRQDLPTRLEMADLTGDLTASALSAGMRAEYRLPLSPNWELSPHAGARYAWIHVDNYTFYSHGAVLDGEPIDQQIWAFPFGMALKGEFETESGWRFAPMLDVQAVPVAGNVEARLKGRYIGTKPDFQIYTQTMDYFTAGGSLGIEARKGDFSLGARVDVQAGLRGSTQAAFANFCYEF